MRECYDPEMPVNIVDLGLVYGVSLENGVVNVLMTLTAPGCQMGAMITQDITDKLLGIPGCEDARVELVCGPSLDAAPDERRGKEKTRDRYLNSGPHYIAPDAAGEISTVRVARNLRRRIVRAFNSTW